MTDRPITEADKLRLAAFRAGEPWTAPAPQVCTARWSDLDWARYVTFKRDPTEDITR